MNNKQQAQVITVHSLVLLMLLVAVHGLVFGQGNHLDPPPNAHAKGYGDGWECDRGYRESGGSCAAIIVPANAYLTNQILRRWLGVRSWLPGSRRDLRSHTSACQRIPYEFTLWERMEVQSRFPGEQRGLSVH
jgi:hypothetical protein